MKLNKYIDHTLLKPEATADDISRLCSEASEYGFYSVCVNSCWAHKASTELTEVKVCSVVGFPLGAMKAEAKAFEAEQARLDGADEIDMVMNIGRLNESTYCLDEIKAVVNASQGAVVKAILETALLDRAGIIRGCEIAQKAGADFVKTSTGFASRGASIEDIKLMREVVGDSMGIKASGGIRTREVAIEMIRAGATRIGASSSVDFY